MAYFERLTVYQKALDFTYKIYKTTETWPKSELFGMTSQIRRAAISISLNIAEGSSRTKKDNAHFLTISRGSCYEIIPLLTLALKMKYIAEKEYNELRNELDEIIKMVSALRNSVIK